VQFAATLLVFVFAGVWLDRRLRTTWLFTVLGTFLGAGGGFYSMYRRVTEAQRQERLRREEAGGKRREGGEV
jgi:F0F1-type ATP synthase assembly protein I